VKTSEDIQETSSGITGDWSLESVM
jgi:hypothetical protein